jgi:transcriptional regulator with XRE-family HTH domain
MDQPVDQPEITPDMVVAESRRFALTIAGQLLLTMAEQNLNEQDMADRLGVSLRTLRFYLRGQNWRGFLPIAAICLSMGTRIEAKLSPLPLK